MKKFYMTMVAMLCGVAAMAQIQYSADDVSATADGKTVSYLKIYMNEESAVANSAGCGIQFPEALFTKTNDTKEVEYMGEMHTVPVYTGGVSIAQVYNEDDEMYVNDVTSPRAKSAHAIELPQHPLYPWAYTLAVSTTGTATFKTSTNVIAEIGLIFAETCPNGEYEITLKPSAAQGTTSLPVAPEEFKVKLTVQGGTGINSINANNSNAPVYNLAGQRVSKAQKGVYIQNGKKVAVK
jgi:hypothetical protein